MLLHLVLTHPNRGVSSPLFSEGKSEIQKDEVTVAGLEGDKDTGLKPRAVGSLRKSQLKQAAFVPEARPHLSGRASLCRHSGARTELG